MEFDNAHYYLLELLFKFEQNLKYINSHFDLALFISVSILIVSYLCYVHHSRVIVSKCRIPLCIVCCHLYGHTG